MVTANASNVEVEGVPSKRDGAKPGNGALPLLHELGRRNFGEQYSDANGSNARIASTSRFKSPALLQRKSSSFFAELKRRDVYKVAVAYAVAGWALAEGISQVFPVFDVPNWAVRLIVVLIIIGLPVALLLAWAFEITPQGIKRTDDILPEEAPDIVRQLEARDRQQFLRGYLCALTYAGLGDKATAIDFLKREYLNQANIDARPILVGPMFDIVHGDRRFETFADKTPDITRINGIVQGIEPLDTDNTTTRQVGLNSGDAAILKSDLAAPEKNGAIHHALHPLKAMLLNEGLEEDAAMPDVPAEA